MKKIVAFLIIFFVFGINVYAKDTVYSMNRYSDEVFDSLLPSYRDDGKRDGYVVAGTFLKEEKVEDGEDFSYTQVMVVHYKKNGEIVWDYQYGKTGDEKFYQMLYSYNEEKERNGYVLLVDESYERGDNPSNHLTFVVLNQEGKFEKEVVSSVSGNIRSAIEILDADSNVGGYIVFGEDLNHHAFLAQFDLNYDLVWYKDYPDYFSIEEVVSVGNFYYVLICKEDHSYQLLQFDLEGNYLSIIRDVFDEVDSPHIVSNQDSFILYGFTNEVKLSRNDANSYYLVQYGDDGEILWDTVGNTEVDINYVIQLQPIIQDGECIEYQLLYINSSDGSIEIVRIGLDGVIGKKIKKIKNDYYHVNSFYSDANVLYFIGQINCPDDDNCDYDTNSLFMVSDEDKVIEVKDNDSKNILFVIGAFFFLLFLGTSLYRNPKKKLR